MKPARNGFSVMSTLLILLVSALISLELGTDVLERMAGNIMKWTNDQRPRIGAAWETTGRTVSASLQLERMISDREEIKRDLRSIEDLAKLPQHLKEEVSVSLSKELFLDLYWMLPPVFARQIGSQGDLLKYYFLDEWDRVSFIKAGEEVDLFILSSQNLVIKRIILYDSFFNNLARWGKALPQGLSPSSDAQWRIISPADFILALSMMEVEIPPWGMELLARGERLTRVGVSLKTIDGMADIGFQFNDGTTLVFPVDEKFAQAVMENLPDFDSLEVEEDLP